jgi:hypothetical protein
MNTCASSGGPLLVVTPQSCKHFSQIYIKILFKKLIGINS